MLKRTSPLHTAETGDVLCRKADTMKVKPKYVADYNTHEWTMLIIASHNAPQYKT